MLKDWINQNIFESCNDLYKNSWFLMKKKSDKYWIVNAAMKVNKITIRDVNLFSNIDSFAENIAEQTVFFLMNFFFNYDQVFLHFEFWNMTVF